MLQAEGDEVVDFCCRLLLQTFVADFCCSFVLVVIIVAVVVVHVVCASLSHACDSPPDARLVFSPWDHHETHTGGTVCGDAADILAVARVANPLVLSRSECVLLGTKRRKIWPCCCED